jgi:SNF2 family DNA or RNA helicase
MPALLQQHPRGAQGLGKTAQSLATLEFQRQLLGNPGPFLVVAPLTTLGHWKRELETWTPMARTPRWAQSTWLGPLPCYSRSGFTC